MIAIINIGENPENKKERVYKIMINRTYITMFTHKRKDGLAVCLKKAAKAVGSKVR